VFGNIDRHHDRIVKGAFADTIRAWQTAARTVPLHWSHGTAADDIIGHVDPSSMVETDNGLVVAGRLDLDNSERARDAWRAMKTGSIGLSFGYMTQRKRRAPGNVTELLALDLFEVSLTPAPANPDTRVLSMKSVAALDLDTDCDELRAKARAEWYALLTAPVDAPEPLDAEAVRKQVEAVEIKSRPPVQVARFDC
jgi:HK97 family phage prohead protease